MNYRETALRRIFTQVQTDYEITGSYGDFSFGEPFVAASTSAYNTSITLTPKPGSLYKGTTTVDFNRIDLDTVQRDLVPSIYDREVRDALEIVNRYTSFDLSPADLYPATIPPLPSSGASAPTRPVTITAHPRSLYYIGSTVLDFTYPRPTGEESELVVISLSGLAPDLKESARAYRADGTYTEWFYYLGNSYDVVVCDVHEAYNAHGGFTYMTGEFELSYHLFGSEYVNRTGRTLVMDHYGMIMELRDDPVYSSSELKTFKYRSGYVYFITDAGVARRFQSGMVRDPDWSIALADPITQLTVGSDLEVWVGWGGVSADTTIHHLNIKHYNANLDELWSISLDTHEPYWDRPGSMESIDGALYVSTLVPVDPSTGIRVLDTARGCSSPFTKVARNGSPDPDYHYYLTDYTRDFESMWDSNALTWVDGDTVNVIKLRASPLGGLVKPIVSAFDTHGDAVTTQLVAAAGLPNYHTVLKYVHNDTELLGVHGVVDELGPLGESLNEIWLVNLRGLTGVGVTPEYPGDQYMFIQRVGDAL